MPAVDFATFCYKGDAYRLHAPGQLEKQVSSNGYTFNQVILVYQNCDPDHYLVTYVTCCPIERVVISHIDGVLRKYGIDLEKPQYQSSTDSHHTWKNHVCNHLAALSVSQADYIVFADIDCWIIRQPDSWIEQAIKALDDPRCLLVSPNDGEPVRWTQVISQQMFMVKTDDFRKVDFNQPGFSGNVRDYPELPEYHAMLEGRLHHYCVATGRYRYVLPSQYRYWHFNKTNPETGLFETDLSKW